MKQEIDWDREAHSYQAVFKTAGKSEYNERLMNFFRQELGLRPGMRVIDIGCGVGKYGTCFAELGCDVTLTDISGEMLKHARENMAPYDVPCAFLRCDFNDVSPDEPVFRKPFSLAISTMSPAIHDEETVRKMSGMCRGYCFISRFCSWQQPIRDEYYRLSGTEPRHRMDSGHLRDDAQQMAETVRKAGFVPSVRIEDYCWTDMRTPEEAARRFAGADASGAEYEKALETVVSLLNKDGKFEDSVNTQAAWIYWKTT